VADDFGTVLDQAPVRCHRKIKDQFRWAAALWRSFPNDWNRRNLVAQAGPYKGPKPLCGRPPPRKGGAAWMTFWSIAVICPAFARGMDGRWPRWVTRIGPQTSRRGLRPKGFPRVFRSSVRPIAILLLSLQAPGQNAVSALLGRKRPAITLTAHHHGPERPSHLVGQRDCRKLLRLAR
jgi:hypothetical protein